MDDPAPHLDTLLELESRHEDLLQRLDELDKEVEKVLKECQSSRHPPLGNGQATTGRERAGGPGNEG